MFGDLEVSYCFNVEGRWQKTHPKISG